MYKTWTKKEEKILLKNPLMSPKLLQNLLKNKTYSSIKHKRNHLKLPKLTKSSKKINIKEFKLLAKTKGITYLANHFKTGAKNLKYLAKLHNIKNLEKIKRLDPKIPTLIREKYSHYVCSARKRKYNFKITPKEFVKFINKPCNYCKSKPNPHNGIDRVNNDKGYVIDNCVTCCSICNRMKSTMTAKQFIKHINKIKG